MPQSLDPPALDGPEVPPVEMQRFLVLSKLPVNESHRPERLRLTPFITYELFEAQRPFDARQGVSADPTTLNNSPCRM